MSSRKFKFISPGIFINEIDRSQIAQLPAAVGPAIIGRFEKGPVLKPVQVNSFEDFVLTFGNPIAGGDNGDMFRDGNYSAPTYGAYAVQAYLRNNSPVTVVRLLGDTNKDADGTANSLAGWRTDQLDVSEPSSLAVQGGAYGLFIVKHDPLNAYTIDFEVSKAATTACAITATFSGSTFDGSLKDAFFILTGTSDVGAHSTFTPAQNAGGFGTGSSDSQTATNFVNAVASASSAGYGAFSAAVTDSTNGVVSVTLSSVYSQLALSSSTSDVALNTAVGVPAALTGATTNTSDRVGTIANETFAFATGSGFAATGTLGAIWYVDEGVVQLDGNDLTCF